MTSEDVLIVTDMSKTFGVVRALRSVDLTVADHEVHGLIGENGSGKSTLTSIIAGAQQPTSGRMVFADADWHPGTTNAALAAGVGMIVQEAGTVPGITVAENMFLGDTRRFSSAG